jgi:predicted alpha/beta-fold hydrolase
MYRYTYTIFRVALFASSVMRRRSPGQNHRAAPSGKLWPARFLARSWYIALQVLLKRCLPLVRTQIGRKYKWFPVSGALILFMLLSFETRAQKGEEWYLFTPDKINLYLYEFGKGDTILVLHGGFGAEHSYMVEALKPLEKKFHFVLFDQRGSLRSPAPDSVLTFDKLLDDVETIRMALKLKKVKLVAHSMGTRIAMAYANKFPQNVESLVLVSSQLLFGQKKNDYGRSFQRKATT